MCLTELRTMCERKRRQLLSDMITTLLGLGQLLAVPTEGR